MVRLEQLRLDGRVRPSGDPFIANVSLLHSRPPTAVVVIAAAPNGIKGNLRVQ